MMESQSQIKVSWSLTCRDTRWACTHALQATLREKAKATKRSWKYSVSCHLLAADCPLPHDYTREYFFLPVSRFRSCTNLPPRTSSNVQCRSGRNSTNTMWSGGHSQRHQLRVEVQHVSFRSVRHAVINCEKQRHKKHHPFQTNDWTCNLKYILMWCLVGLAQQGIVHFNFNNRVVSCHLLFFYAPLIKMCHKMGCFSFLLFEMFKAKHPDFELFR